jgi:hypothetical protein
MKKILVALLLFISCDLQAQPGIKDINENINECRSTDVRNADFRYNYIIDSTSDLSKLSNLRSLRKASFIIKLNALPKEIYLLSDTLREITLSCQNDQLADISSLSGLKNLKIITLKGVSNITYLNQLLNLTDINIWNYPKSDLRIDLHELTKLKTLNIRFGNLKHIIATQNFQSLDELYIGDLDSVENLEVGKMNSKKITISECRYLKSVSSLSSCKSLKELCLDNNYVLKKLDLNFNKMVLDTLELSYCWLLNDLSAMAGSKTLKTLKLDGLDSIKSINFDMSKMNLESVEIKSDSYYGDHLKNIDGICRCKSLKKIVLNGLDSLKSLNFNSYDLKLEALDVNDCKSIKGIFGLSKCKFLNEMLIGRNASLVDIPDLKSNLSFVKWVYVHDNRILMIANKSIFDRKSNKNWAILDNAN